MSRCPSNFSKVRQRRTLEKPVEIKVPREFMDILGLRDVEGLERRSRILLAVELYMDGKVSLGRAAELAGVSYDEFWDSLKERGHKIRVGPKSLAEAESEHKAAKEHLEK